MAEKGAASGEEQGVTELIGREIKSASPGLSAAPMSPLPVCSLLCPGVLQRGMHAPGCLEDRLDVGLGRAGVSADLEEEVGGDVSHCVRVRVQCSPMSVYHRPAVLSWP